MSRLKETYQKEVVPALKKEFGYGNVMAIPRIEKVVVNMGLGEATEREARRHRRRRAGAHHRPEAGDAPREEVDRAVQAAQGHAGRRDGDAARRADVGVPRSPDQRSRCRACATSAACRRKGFDGRGNFTLGLRDQLLFPEIDYMKVDKARGMNVSVVTTAKTDEEARKLLQLWACRSRTN